MITPSDINRLCAEMVENNHSPDKWMQENDFPFETIQELTQYGHMALILKLGAGKDLYQALSEVFSNMFVLGFEAGQQYGKKR